MSEIEYKLVCRECKAEDSIRSDERIFASFRMFPSDANTIEHDGSSEKQYDSFVNGYFCEGCDHSFAYTEVLEMITRFEIESICVACGGELDFGMRGDGPAFQDEQIGKDGLIFFYNYCGKCSGTESVSKQKE